MKLYYDHTLNPRKACAVARHLQLPVEFVHVRLSQGEHKRPDFLALNPNGRLPVLQDGGIVVWEANAIMCHLAIAAGSDLWPRDPASQVEVQRWLSWDAFHFMPHGGTLYFEHVVKPFIGMGATDPQVVQAASRAFEASATVLDQHLERRQFLLGDALSIADFAVSAALPWAQEADLPLDKFPSIGRWHDRLSALEGWREPFPSA
jgi:glutathione S-transferase